ncbi:MAG: AMP-binding protein, partial [bacterium]|nr:AMP-binding protein [bacterium]
PTLVVVPEETRFDGAELVKYYKDKQVRVSDGTPVHLKLIITSRELGTEFPVKQFVVGGEALERELVEKVMERLGGDEFKIVNVYGPTECCDVATTYTVTSGTDTRALIPIGRPISNVKIYILGRYGEMQGIGVPGELYIGGSGLGRGYLNKPELTAEKFVMHPEALYRTGDLACWQPGGNIVFLGRIDHQVKIRG